MKKKHAPNRPKRPPTAYIRFTNELRKKDPSIKKLTVGEAATSFSKQWQELCQEEKDRLCDEYNKEMKIYSEAFAEYKKTDEYKESLKKNKKPKRIRNVSPYNVFLAETYAQKKKEGCGEFKQVATEVSKLWSQMSEECKQDFQRKADELN
ncbi:hypothetical protein H311_04924, partial [Anncaliia algerae PRA109]